MFHCAWVPLYSRDLPDSCMVIHFQQEGKVDTLHIGGMEVDSLIQQYRHAGYLKTTSFAVSDSPCVQWLVQGDRLVFGQVEANFVQINRLRRADVAYGQLSGQELSADTWNNFARQVISHLENNGYPFASIRIEALSAGEDNQLDAWLHIDPGPLITYRMLVMPEEAPVSVRYLERYLGILPGQPYRESDIRNINALLDDLPFVEARAQPAVQFTGEEATVFIFPVRRPANRFDFILGVLPLPANDPSGRRLLITGMADLMLINPWKKGQTLGFSFRQTRPETQELSVKYEIPYILGTPLGAEAAFELYRRDTLYLDLHRRVGVQYAFRGRHFLEGYWDFHSSSLLSVPIEQIRHNKELPQNLDFRRNIFGVRYVRERFDYRYNPSQGFAITVDISAGTRQVLRNPQITNIDDPVAPDFSYASLYLPYEYPAVQWIPKIDLQYFFPLYGRHILHSRITAKAIFGASVISNNEKFRVGGFQIMRGFDEESIHTPAFGMGRLEYRFLLDRDAHFHLFLDQGFSPETVDRSAPWTFFTGFGAGLQFQTVAGVFGVSYALGRTSEIPLDLRTGKIHFGYATMF